MPCFKQEKSLEFRSRRDKTNDRNPMAPRPVRPRSMRYHGLFGLSVAAQHFIVDEKWMPSSLAEEFTKMTDMLRRRVIYKRHETKTHRKSLVVESKKLKLQCADGHRKLQRISSGNNAHKIRNYLRHHRYMQRLYQKMPLYQIADNINQRTFVMRKERDRLEFRLGLLKQKYRELLLDRSTIQNRLKYEAEFELEEELQSRVLLKKIQNSDVRMRAIRTINTTYKKMLKVLLHDEIFYEPILHSLDDDMEDQSNFIKHILYLGIPAISKFRVLNHEFRRLEEKSRKNHLAKIQILNSLKKPVVIGPPEIKVREILTADPKRYVRQTQSMEMLKMELQSIEQTIKDLKLTVLCSQAKEIYPRIKSQLESNRLLHRKIEFTRVEKGMLNARMSCATLLQEVLINNLSEEEINRLNRIVELKATLESLDEEKLEGLDYLRNRAEVFVMMRLTLWNFIEVLRHIDRTPLTFRKKYPNVYLQLPLLKFELLDSTASPPAIFEENVEELLHLLKRKTYKLTNAFTPEMKKNMASCREKYQMTMFGTIDHENAGHNDAADAAPQNVELIVDKALALIPNRKQIKAQSARLCEEAIKRLDE